MFDIWLPGLARDVIMGMEAGILSVQQRVPNIDRHEAEEEILFEMKSATFAIVIIIIIALFSHLQISLKGKIHQIPLQTMSEDWSCWEDLRHCYQLKEPYQQSRGAEKSKHGGQMRCYSIVCRLSWREQLSLQDKIKGNTKILTFIISICGRCNLTMSQICDRLRQFIVIF